MTDPASHGARALLVSLGADGLPHPGGTLLEHLVRVRDLLASWDAPPDVCLAGLCHAVYGTDGFGVALLPLQDRTRLVDVIGASAEAIVYRYASCDRGLTYPALGAADLVFADRFSGTSEPIGAAAAAEFMEITAANEFDVVQHNPEIAERAGPQLRELMTRGRHHLSPAAVAAWDCRA